MPPEFSSCKRYAAVLACLVLLEGCTAKSPTVTIPTAPPSNIEVTGVAAGTLTFHDGCLRLSTPSEHYLIIWTRGTRFDVDVTPPTVTDQTGVTRRVGDHVALGGGEIDAVNFRNVPATAAAISRCGGPLWLTHGFKEPMTRS